MTSFLRLDDVYWNRNVITSISFHNKFFTCIKLFLNIFLQIYLSIYLCVQERERDERERERERECVCVCLWLCVCVIKIWHWTTFKCWWLYNPTNHRPKYGASRTQTVLPLCKLTCGLWSLTYLLETNTLNETGMLYIYIYICVCVCVCECVCVCVWHVRVYEKRSEKKKKRMIVCKSFWYIFFLFCQIYFVFSFIVIF